MSEALSQCIMTAILNGLRLGKTQGIAEKSCIRDMTGFSVREKSMRNHTLAEGMETEEQAAFLEEIGCELAQGYAFHRPESLEAILYRIKSGEKVRPLEPRENWYQLI